MLTTPDAVTGAPRLWLRLEGLAAFLFALYLYARGGHSWALFAMLFFVPDVSFAGYLGGPRVGSWCYNVLHSYIGPLMLAVVLLASDRPLVVALIWTAHIGFDRSLGYGLKYPTAFHDTHLGRLGRALRPRDGAED